MRKRFIVIAVAATSAVALTVGGVALANNGGGTTATVEPAVLDDSNMKTVLHDDRWRDGAADDEDGGALVG
jgi:hypothetical protein